MIDEYGLTKNEYLTYCPVCGSVATVTCNDPSKLPNVDVPACFPCSESSLFSKRRWTTDVIITKHCLYDWVDGKKEATTYSKIPLRAYQFIWDTYVDVPENNKLIPEALEETKERVTAFLEAGGYNGIVRYVCPKCKCSTTAPGSAQGFSVGKAAAGVVAVGPVGALAGAAGMNKKKRTCPNCGYKW